MRLDAYSVYTLTQCAAWSIPLIQLADLCSCLLELFQLLNCHIQADLFLSTLHLVVTIPNVDCLRRELIVTDN